MNFYKRHIGDYIKDTSHLSLLEHGIYTRLLDVYYTRERALPAFDATARLIGARSDEERSALRDVLNEYFTETADGFMQDRCEREIEVAAAAADRSREVGKLGGRPRKDETQQVSAENPAGYFQKPTDNPSQTPDTRHQRKDKKTTPDKPTDVPDSVWSDFLALRKSKRSPLTPTALAGIEREAKAANLSLGDALRMSCERGWQGFKASWLDPKEQATAKASARGSGWWTAIGYGSEAMARADGKRPDERAA